VGVDTLQRVANGRDRARLGGDELEQRRETARRALREPVARRQIRHASLERARHDRFP
jgi:hypothetical protein